LATWRRHGYVPPSEQKEYQDKWQYYLTLPTRKENPAEAGKGSETQGAKVMIKENLWIANTVQTKDRFTT
jgi:hypothetical protein